MGVNNGNSKLEHNSVPRLLVAVIDQFAASEPEHPYIFQAKSNRPEDGWEPVTFKQFANAIDCVAHIITETVKNSSSDKFPTLAYVGPSDVRYGILAFAAVKAGCQALFVSPRNSVEGQLSLFEATNCNHIWYESSFHQPVCKWTAERKMQSWAVPQADEWLHASTKPFPYTKTFEEARWDPLVVLHTSGSTGIPKPIVVRQGATAIVDTFRSLPEFHGSEIFFNYWKSHATRFFSPLPAFHAAGMLCNFMTVPIYFGLPTALPPVGQPVTADLILKCLQHSGSDGGIFAPSILEDLSFMDEGVEALRKLSFAAFAGGNLSKTAGDHLTERGVILSDVISSTEHTPYALYSQPNPKLWQYFIFNSEQMGAVWRPHDPEEGIYELALRRKDPNDPLDQAVFYTFPDLTEWSTGDLYKAHPTLKDHWLYQGRADNVIVFSNGEKLNPVTIEDGVVGHRLIKGALVVGQDRFQPALILEPNTPPKSEDEAQRLIDDVWPLIEELNKETVAHGRISRQLVALSDPDIPFPRAGKGTIQRVAATRAYKQMSDEMYQRAGAINAADVVSIDLSTKSSVLQSLLELLTDKMKITQIEADTDFFSAGIDSLQVLTISRLLKAGFEASGVTVSPAVFAPRSIYSNPTPNQLAEHLYAATHVNGVSQNGQNGQDGTDNSIFASLVSKYTDNLPGPQTGKPVPNDDGQTVIMTGSTGSLGAYMLDILCKLPNVKSIIALNRGEDGGESRQPSVNSDRGLGSNFSKVTFLKSDLSKPDFGLGDAKYKELLSVADRIIHNAWPVNFNINLSSFEPYIRGVRHLVDFSSAATKQVSIVFLSSISTAGNWTKSKLVPERQLADPSLAQMGYGLSKLAGSLILDAAAEKSGIPCASIRVGQIAGPRGAKGKWNPQEFMPSLVASSVYLGILPRELGASDVVDWMAIEDVARVILEVSGVAQTKKSLSDISGYFHCVNPKTADWADMAVAIKDYYAGRIKELVSIDEWVAALEKSAIDTANIDRNPAIKLLDTFQGFVQAKKAGIEHVYFDMERTVSQSQTAAEVNPVTTDLMRNWCAQWDY
ncbi:hypothetical protein QQS21_004024 [Conoideocrella luteorostrata]|uniref:Carrier domain-containing protein n=1 Tax=Conoideocrella luteorostrata TaxID=1105319 RepID=A0AAJ0G058_9HYPO|nr:hypothetical protein QQS21_004024 [Conoideocrella luteorostrata]